MEPKPIYDNEAEETFLGACCRDIDEDKGRNLTEIIDQVWPAYLYSPRHQTIFQAIESVAKGKIPPDLSSLSGHLKKCDIPISKLIELSDDYINGTLPHSKQRLQEFYRRRQIQALAKKVEDLTVECSEIDNDLQAIQRNGILHDDSEGFKSVLVDANDLIGMEIPTKETILFPWVNEKSIILTSAWRGFGKTWFWLSICDCISRGEKFGPWATQNPVPMLYLDGEMPLCDIQDRLKRLNKGRGQRKARLTIYNDDRANSLGFPEPICLIRHGERNS